MQVILMNVHNGPQDTGKHRRNTDSVEIDPIKGAHIRLMAIHSAELSQIQNIYSNLSQNFSDFLNHLSQSYRPDEKEKKVLLSGLKKGLRDRDRNFNLSIKELTKQLEKKECPKTLNDFVKLKALLSSDLEKTKNRLNYLEKSVRDHQKIFSTKSFQTHPLTKEIDAIVDSHNQKMIDYNKKQQKWRQEEKEMESTFKNAHAHTPQVSDGLNTKRKKVDHPSSMTHLYTKEKSIEQKQPEEMVSIQLPASASVSPEESKEFLKDMAGGDSYIYLHPPESPSPIFHSRPASPDFSQLTPKRTNQETPKLDTYDAFHKAMSRGDLYLNLDQPESPDFSSGSSSPKFHLVPPDESETDPNESETDSMSKKKTFKRPK